MSSKNVLKLIKDKQVEFVDLRFTDPKGKLQHVTMDGSMVDEEMLDKGIFFDGDQKNIKLPWEKIMRETIEPGSIQLEKNNGAPILFNGAINPKDAAIMMLVGKLYEHL